MSRREPRVGRHADGGERRQVGGGTAELVADPDRPQAWTLYVDGTPQSHVDLADPTYLEFEYIRWFGHVADVMAPAGIPLNVLHLGGGAWTLARYLAATRPGSRQRVVEIDTRLVEFVREHLPSEGSGVRVRTGDAREVLAGLSAESVDLLVVDVFEGARIPAHLTTREFVADAARVLRPAGVLAVNVADGDRLSFARSVAATLSDVFTHVAVVAPAPLLRGRRFGNLGLLASRVELPLIDLARRTAGDPFPARVVGGAGGGGTGGGGTGGGEGDVGRFVAGARVITDADAAPSPAPPEGIMGV